VPKEFLVANAPYLAGAASLFSLAFAFYLVRYILKQDAGNERVQDLSQYIQQGARTFMQREFRNLSIFGVVVAILLYVMPETGLPTTVGFIVGTIASALAGWIGMWIATKSNGRTAHAAQTSFPKALNIAYSGGSTMGFSVVGLGLLGLAVIYILFPEHSHAWLGYAFGSSCVALFLRVGGGIYTKSADVGADVVGKVEAGIPEDDPRNPGVIADNVGDNVGDVAGMGSDLYESYVSAVAATMFLGKEVDFAASFPGLGFENLGLNVAFLFGMLGILASVVGYFFVSAEDDTDVSYEQQAANARSALNRGTTVANVLVSALALGLIFWLIPSGESAAAVIDGAKSGLDVRWALFLVLLAGLLTGVVIGKATEYYTSEYAPVKGIAEAAKTGAATTIIEGLGTGMVSTVVPALAVGAATLLAYHLGGLFGIALASLGMLLTLGVVLSTDAYGPITDNAQGISEMADLGQDVRERCEALDSAGNTTAAIGKGFAIGSAALAALAWLATYFSEAAAQDLLSLEAGVNLMNPSVLVGLLLDGRQVEGEHGADPGGRAAGPRRVGPGWTAGRGAHVRLSDGHLHVQRRRRLGQRQEVHRVRRARRQGQRGAQGVRRGRHGGRSAEGHLRPLPQRAHQAHGQGGGDLPPALCLPRRIVASGSRTTHPPIGIASGRGVFVFFVYALNVKTLNVRTLDVERLGVAVVWGVGDGIRHERALPLENGITQYEIRNTETHASRPHASVPTPLAGGAGVSCTHSSPCRDPCGWR